MLEPQQPSTESSAFKRWLEEDASSSFSSTFLSASEQQALQHYLQWTTVCEEANTLPDQAVENTVQQVYQRLGIYDNAMSSTQAQSISPVSTEPEPAQTWWERWGFSQWVIQPMGLASAAMVLIAVVGSSVLWRYQAPIEEVEVTRGASVEAPNPSPTTPKPIATYTLEVANVDQMATSLMRDLSATHFSITEPEDLGAEGKRMVIRSPNAPVTQTTRQILQHYQLEAWLSAPNTTIRLHLKAKTP